ncbi:MAG TPA: Lrp/AsnC family transcriptional regulator, partial [Armatimonadetes bacterium]|nr:Lrp/AsnC family transcriptional regulator [Armatimonadota bacterium]
MQSKLHKWNATYNAISALHPLDAQLLNHVQYSIPLEREPYATIGSSLNIATDEVIMRLNQLKASGFIRTISGIFDASRLGYQTMLVAMAVPDSKLDDAAIIINAHSGVSHNYARNAEFNLWFTLTVPRTENLTQVVSKLAEACNATDWLLLPTLRRFKIGVALDAVGGRGNIFEGTDASSKPTRPITDEDVQCICLLQREFPIALRPYDELARSIGKTYEWLLERAQLLSSEGRLRRIAAIVRHRKLGYNTNAMVVWAVPDELVEQVGRKLASFPQVSHC